jgi:hypothetical protein
MSSTKTIQAIASNEYEFNGVVKFCFSLTGRVRQFGPGRSPARAGAGQHVEEQRRLQALITRGSSTRTSKSN